MPTRLTDVQAGVKRARRVKAESPFTRRSPRSPRRRRRRFSYFRKMTGCRVKQLLSWLSAERQFMLVMIESSTSPLRISAMPARPARCSQKCAGLLNSHTSSPTCMRVRNLGRCRAISSSLRRRTSQSFGTSGFGSGTCIFRGNQLRTKSGQASNAPAYTSVKNAIIFQRG